MEKLYTCYSYTSKMFFVDRSSGFLMRKPMEFWEAMGATDPEFYELKETTFDDTLKEIMDEAQAELNLRERYGIKNADVEVAQDMRQLEEKE